MDITTIQVGPGMDPSSPRVGVGASADREAGELVFGDQPPLLGQNFDLEFRREVAQLIHGILQRSYVTRRDLALDSARTRGISVEQLVASAIAYHVMKKVDEEYI